MALRMAPVHFFGEQVQNTTDRRGRAGGVDRTEHQVTGFRSVNGGQERLLVAHLTDQDDVGVFAHSVLHPDFKVLHIHADLALIDQAFIFGIHELDRVFQGEDVFAVDRVDVVEHRTDRRTLTEPVTPASSTMP